MAHKNDINAAYKDQSEKDIIYLRGMISIYAGPQPKVAAAMTNIVDGLENFNKICFEEDEE